MVANFPLFVARGKLPQVPLDGDGLSELAHPPSDRILTEAFEDAPGDDLVEQDSLGLHRAVQAARALYALEELEDGLSCEHND